MRSVFPLLALFVAAPALAGDVEGGVDLDAVFAAGSSVSGPGGGATVRVGYGPNPIKLGPSALSIAGEIGASYWRFPSASADDVDMLRGLVGARGTFTLAWLRKPAEDGGRGRGIRLDLPIVLRGGVASVDRGNRWTPTADTTIGIALGLLPVQIGVHMGVGGIAASQQVEGLDGSAWANAGVDVGFVF